MERREEGEAADAMTHGAEVGHETGTDRTAQGWCWGKSRRAPSSRSSLRGELSTQRECNSVTDFSYIYVH